VLHCGSGTTAIRLGVSHISNNPVLDDNVYSGRESIVEEIQYRETGAHAVARALDYEQRSRLGTREVW
jgi:hypothetical protein